jgi:hypothetical protein
MMIAQTATRLREQIAHFSGNLSRGLCKPARRLVQEAIYGIQARQSVHLTEIARSLEEKIPLIKTENRLSRNLARPNLRLSLQDALVSQGAKRIHENTLLILDLSDVVKPYAKKMECLARVRDGSEGKIADGYWLCQVIGVENEGNEITPLYGELYSSSAQDFVSENREILRALRQVSEEVKPRGIWVIDRGGDRGKLYEELIPHGLRFIVRQMGDRHLLLGRRRELALQIAQDCPLPYQTQVVREVKGKEQIFHLRYGFRAVRLPEYRQVELFLVVVQGLGETPLMLLTNLPMRRNRRLIWWVVSAYLTRWRVEETIRFGKQSYQVEDIRVLTYERLRNLVVLVTAAMFFTAVVLGAKMKLFILASHVLKAAKRLFGIPDFRYYALSDGIREILSRFPRRSPSGPNRFLYEQQYLLFET